MDRFVFDAVIHPHRSLSADGFRVLFYLVVLANLVTAGAMIALGGWPVLGFLGLDILGVYAAFRVSYAQTRAFERVTIDSDALTVRRSDVKGATDEWTFPAYWVNVWFDGDDEHGTVTLRSHGRSLEIGAYLAPFERQSFAEALREALRTAKSSTAGAQA